MATYVQLASIDQFDALRAQVLIALAVECNNFLTEVPATTNHAAHVAFAQTTIGNLAGTRENVLPLVLAANAGATVAQIQAATDAQVQTAVHNAVLGIVGG